MTSKTHVSLGVAFAAPLVTTYSYNIEYILVALIGAIAADFDVNLPIKHRTWTHSILALSISTIILSTFDKSIALFLFVGYSTHLVADSFTKMGVPFFYPFIKENYGLKLCTTGKTTDILIRYIALIAIFYFCYIYILNTVNFNFLLGLQ